MPYRTKLNFLGDGVTASQVGDAVEVDVSGSAAGIGKVVQTIYQDSGSLDVADTRIDLGGAQNPYPLSSWVNHAQTNLALGRLVFAEVGIYSFNFKIKLISGSNYPYASWPDIGAYDLHNSDTDAPAAFQGTFASNGLVLPAGGSFSIQFTNYYEVGDEIVVYVQPPAGWTSRTYQSWVTLVKIM
jgi:hypothetical protein